MNEETKEVSSMIFDFAEHVKTVYELPMFYGDETLSSLLEHARAVVENINEIDFILEEEEEEVFLSPELERDPKFTSMQQILAQKASGAL